MNLECINQVNAEIMCCYLNWRKLNGAKPPTLNKEYCGILAIISHINHPFIDWKNKNSWSQCTEWIKHYKKGYEPETAPEFTMHELQKLKNWPDPENKLFMLKLCSFFGLNLRLRAIEYTRIFFENIKILIQGILIILILSIKNIFIKYIFYLHSYLLSIFILILYIGFCLFE